MHHWTCVCMRLDHPKEGNWIRFQLCYLELKPESDVLGGKRRRQQAEGKVREKEKGNRSHKLLRAFDCSLQPSENGAPDLVISSLRWFRFALVASASCLFRTSDLFVGRQPCGPATLLVPPSSYHDGRLEVPYQRMESI